MDVNKTRLLIYGTNNKSIDIPIEMNWNFGGQEQSIELYEEEVINQVIGRGYDFEVDRFPHDIEPLTNKTEINYEFYLFSGSSITDVNNWKNSYLNKFTPQEVYYFANNFSNSFFKLDFYDTVDNKSQKNYLSVIIPTQQGVKTQTTMSNTIVDVRTPKFFLDYVGDKEGFFIYWLKNLDFVPINTFYMTAKFYNAKTGNFIRMMTRPQGSFNVVELNNFDVNLYYYYRVVFDYVNKCYRVFDSVTKNRVGTTTPIKWYEYVNPR